MSKHDLRRRQQELRARIADQRSRPDQPSCVETALQRELEQVEASLASQPEPGQPEPNQPAEPAP